MQFEFYLNELHDEVLEIFFAIEIRAGFNMIVLHKHPAGVSMDSDK